MKSPRTLIEMITKLYDHGPNTNDGNTPSGADTGGERSYDDRELTDRPPDAKGLNLSQTAEQSSRVKMKHVEVLVKQMDMRLSE